MFLLLPIIDMIPWTYYLRQEDGNGEVAGSGIGRNGMGIARCVESSCIGSTLTIQLLYQSVVKSPVLPGLSQLAVEHLGIILRLDFLLQLGCLAR
jgi:hypothetical protein